MNNRLKTGLRYGLFANLVLAALMHGAVDSWSAAIFELLTLCLFAAWLLGKIVAGRVSFEWPTVGWPLLGFLLLGLAQAYAWEGDKQQLHSLSWDVEATRMVVLILFCQCLNFLMFVDVLARRPALQQLIYWLIGYGTLLALFGLLQHFTWNGKMYWVEEMAVAVGSAFGPFVNRNHFAGYLEMLVTFPAAFLTMRVIKREQRVFFGFLTVLMGIAIVVSLSRGGMVSLFCSLLVVVALGVPELRRRTVSQTSPQTDSQRRWLSISSAAAVVVLAVIIVVGVLWVAGDPVLDRLERSQMSKDESGNQSLYDSRGFLWQATWQMITAHPLSGVGMGAYATAYPQYSLNDSSIYRVEHVHNDYLQVLSDTGLIGGVLTLWFMILLLQTCWRALRQPDWHLASIALGCCGGISGIAIHSLFDFNLQIPSNGLLLLLLVAIVAVIAQPGNVAPVQPRAA